MKQQQATMKRLFFFAAAAAALASCSETDELALSQAQQQAKGNEVSFSVYTNRATRAGEAGEMTTTALKGENAGFGIFAYHTNNSFYDEQNSEPNFMYNQKVMWDDTKEWFYDPVKYWPNEFGDNAKSNDIDYVTFFAYAPFVDFDPATGSAPVAEGDDAEQEQWKNITGASRNGDNGDPFVRYMVDTNPSTSVDLLWGVAGKVPTGLADSKAPASQKTQPNGPFLNLSKQVGVADKLEWKFYHALAKLNVQIIAAADVATQGDAIYDPEDQDPLNNVDEATKIYLRWIEFNGFAMTGALNLNSPSTVARWFGYDGATDLKGGTVRFNDGLLDDKEGIADNVNPNERVLGKLNPELIEEPTAIAADDKDVIDQWKAKQAGIPTTGYVNLFDGATDERQSFYVIPTGEPLKISMLYDIMTADKRLNKYLSDGVTPGSHVSNEITKDLNGMKIYAGKAYDIKIVVGVESIKVTATVKDWDDADTNPTDVDMPYNYDGGVTISGENTLAIGGSTTLTATVLSDDVTDKTVTWSSSNTEVATVDASTGKVTAVAEGEVTITATVTNGTPDDTSDDLTATFKITVTSSGARPTMGTLGGRTGYGAATGGNWF